MDIQHDTAPRVNNLYCFSVKNSPERNALGDWENIQDFQIYRYFPKPAKTEEHKTAHQQDVQVQLVF